jgi:hypothetical protein
MAAAGDHRRRQEGRGQHDQLGQADQRDLAAGGERDRRRCAAEDRREQRGDAERDEHPADAAGIARAAEPADEDDERLQHVDDELLQELSGDDRRGAAAR